MGIWSADRRGAARKIETGNRTRQTMVRQREREICSYLRSASTPWLPQDQPWCEPPEVRIPAPWRRSPEGSELGRPWQSVTECRCNGEGENKTTARTGTARLPWGVRPGQAGRTRLSLDPGRRCAASARGSFFAPAGTGPDASRAKPLPCFVHPTGLDAGGTALAERLANLPPWPWHPQHRRPPGMQVNIEYCGQ